MTSLDNVAKEQSVLQKLKLKPGYHNHFSDAYGSAFAHSIAQLASEYSGVILVLLKDAATLQPLQQELKFFLKDSAQIPVISLPDWETLPYDYFSPHQDIISERLQTLYQLPQLERAILLSPVSSCLQKLPTRNYIEQSCLSLKVDQSVNLQSMLQRLSNAGYQRCSTVMQHGEFAVRGSIVDLFPMGSKHPIRIEFFDEQIESLRYFDVDNQLTFSKVSQINLLPAKEYPSDEKAITNFRQEWRTHFATNQQQGAIYRDVSNGIFPAGIEYYLPLFFQQLSSLFDFIDSENKLIVHQGELTLSVSNFWQELNERYEQYRHDIERPILPPDQLFMQQDEFFSQLKNFPHLVINKQNNSACSLNYQPCPQVQIQQQTSSSLEQLNTAINPYTKVLFCAESKGRQEVLREMLLKNTIKVTKINNWQNFLASSEKHLLITAPLRWGFATQDYLIICESDLFGNRILNRGKTSDKSVSTDLLIHSLAELKIGDPVVHLEQGVGRYLGLQSLTTGGITTEFFILQYLGDDKLYVPVQSLHMIHRYSGSNPETAPWHKLGNESWGKAKNKAMQKARDTAAELLDIYARRAAEIGNSCQLNAIDYQQFASEFAFEPTQDQQNAIDGVIQDMQSEQPMDRLICGDVGFGKTEVAMRAAFIAVQNNSQVAMLVPTTLLAQQHFNSFQDRFANWPVNIGVLSRFQSKKEQQTLITQLESGEIDIVIGTHRLLTSQPKFKNLGLLLIDEEHRFGVRQKEILKSFRTKVDILTLTATPIPRTLNMSMSGMRDLSIIATPPAKRLAIKTFVRQHHLPLIKEAIQREIRRGGQVYYLHNSVDTIERTANQLRELMPDLAIAVAHGQMRERELEQVMKQFYHQQHHLLVCTTIIETGIDIPTANTIIIDRADKLGLAQLHQLRGRVGRSHHQAYAYLLTPNPKNITADARKRLQAIENLEDLGAGFILSTHDLEIRGAGELLGDEQSGHMQSIGFNLYMELLDRAVIALKSGNEPSLQDLQSNQTEVNLGESSLLPDDYVPDVSIRLSLYKRIANAKNQQQLKQLKIELIDRFGLLPEETQCLFITTELKLLLSPMGILKLEADQQAIHLEFSEAPSIDTQKIIQLIQTSPQEYRLIKANRLKVDSPNDNLEQRKQQIDSLIEILSC